MIILTIIGALVVIALTGIGIHFAFSRLTETYYNRKSLEWASDKLDKLTKHTEKNDE